MISGQSSSLEVTGAPAIWVVEDNGAYRESLVKVITPISRAGTVRSFGDCEDALAAIQAGDIPDVLLLDIGLPGMGGLQGLSRFKAVAPDLRIVMVTSFDDHDRIFKALCAGASGYLVKSSALGKITEAIAEVRSGGAPMSPPVAAAVLRMFNRLGPVPASTPDYGLSPREKETLMGMVDGLTMKAIADRLGVSYHTVDTYVRNIYTKLHVTCRASAVAKSLRERLF
ncbi:MAG TPA: response regulator transcription factor [Candidatus Limnocylindria bacterium]|jgi:DNA-binding NarL/FixJ family response regulator|nr:response regulator transcription factor [Candidatus Limnocylindria bacterium]